MVRKLDCALVITSERLRLRLPWTSEITRYLGLELDPKGFLGQDKPENTNPIDCDARQQIQNELRIVVSIE